MSIKPQISIYGTKRFNIVDALKAVEEGRWGERRGRIPKKVVAASGEKYLLRVPLLGGETPPLRELLDSMLLTNQQLCKMTGIHHSTMSRIANGKHFPCHKNAISIAKAVTTLLRERGLEDVLTPADIWPGIPLLNRG
jgi:hypothetical protein